MRKSDIEKLNYTNNGNAYVLKGNEATHWTGFYKSIVNDLQRKFGDKFFLIIYWKTNKTDDNESDYEITYCSIPFAFIKDIMVEDRLTQGKSKPRWMAGIVNGKFFRIRGNTHTYKDVSSFFNHITPFSSLINDEAGGEMIISNHEGERQNKLHKTIERDRKFIDQIKSKYKSIDPYLHCQICGFSSLEKYGTIGDGCIEAHHIKPLSELTEQTQTKEEDIIFLCPNCHRVIHSHNPILKVSDVKNALKQLRN